jgi:hypothetical protein
MKITFLFEKLSFGSPSGRYPPDNLGSKTTFKQLVEHTLIVDVCLPRTEKRVISSELSGINPNLGRVIANSSTL